MNGRLGLRSRSRGSAWAPAMLAVAVAATAWAGSASAQDRRADFGERPILVLNTGGHGSTVRQLAFAADGLTLLSAGDDKVVRVWSDLRGDAPGLERVIRPPIWRGQAGAIRAMALAGPPGRQRLALAGFGVESHRGEIKIYNFPGDDARPQGDLAAVLAGGDLGDGKPEDLPPPERAGGHVNVVNALAFDPTGTILASAGDDSTVRLWDMATMAPLEVLWPGKDWPADKAAPDRAGVGALAFSPDGKFLYYGDKRGALWGWDLAIRGRAKRAFYIPAATVPGASIESYAINCLAVRRDGGRLVFGRENGQLVSLKRWNDPNEPASVFKDQPGPVEAVAFGPKGELATSVLVRVAQGAEPPDPSCLIQLRRPETLDVVAEVARTTNLACALAFSPGGTFLAFGGGDRQEIQLKVVADANPPIRLSEATSRGSSIWDVGFVGNSAVAYSTERAPAQPPASYLGFDLAARRPGEYDRAQVRRALPDFEGWGVERVDSFQLRLTRAGAAPIPIALGRALDGRWWAHSFIPPGPGHPGPLLAIACEAGVAVYRTDGVRTRFLDGHNGAVYCLAPSPDGRWLATGSVDQTIRLWPLAGLDEPAALGAEFERRGANLVVKAVVPRGFADLGDFRAGDVAEAFAIGREAKTADQFLREFPNVPPNTSIQIIGHRRGEPAPGAPAGAPVPDVAFRAMTTKRDGPALSLFVGRDLEWVLWTPRGLYDTSIAGDSRLLGWQVNKYARGRPVPTDYFPIRTHEKDLRQPRERPGNAIDLLLGGADPRAVEAAPPPPGVVVDPQDVNRPPIVTALAGAGGAPLLGPGRVAIPIGSPLPPTVTLAAPGILAIDWRVDTRLIRDPAPAVIRPPGPFEVRVDGQVIRVAAVPAPAQFDPVAGVATVPFRHPVAAGSHAILAVADVGLGREREVTLAAAVEGPPPPVPPSRPRLRVLAIAPKSPDGVPTIKGAEKDARDLSTFFAGYLVGAYRQAFAPLPPDGPELVGVAATGQNVVEAIKKAGTGPDALGPGDALVVIVEAHVLTPKVAGDPDGRVRSRLIVADTAGPPIKADATVPADEVGAELGALVARGCRVVVVLDGLHKPPATAQGWGEWDSNVKELARDLWLRHRVVTVVPSQVKTIDDPLVERNRPLARAILESFENRARRPGRDSTSMGLSAFNDAFQKGVFKVTQRKVADGAVLVPSGVDAGRPFLDLRPQPGP